MESVKAFVASSKSVLKTFLFLFLFFLYTSTIHAVTPEQQLDRITMLPGQPLVTFAQFSGYVPVNEEHGRALFYYLTEAASQPETKPLLIWFNGGPGCSGLAFGGFEEIGPFRINKDASALYLANYSWNKMANLLFVESPAGVGFSYTNTTSDLTDSGDLRTSQDALTFLIRWLLRFPQYKQRDLYLAGESYAGHYVPQLAEQIVDYNKKSPNATINLKGFMVGNAIIDKKYDTELGFTFAWSHSLISDQTYKAIMKSCDFSTTNTSKQCDDAQETAAKEGGNVNPYQIYAPNCKVPNYSPFADTNTSKPSFAGYDPCTWNSIKKYFIRPDVQKALHVTGIPYQYSPCSKVLNSNWKDGAFSMLPTYKKLIGAGLRIWVYSGDLDSVVSAIGTQAALNQLNLTIKTPFYPWYSSGGEVGGRATVYNGLTFTTVRGAGHEAPFFQPKRTFIVFQSFLQGKDLPNS